MILKGSLKDVLCHTWVWIGSWSMIWVFHSLYSIEDVNKYVSEQSWHNYCGTSIFPHVGMCEPLSVSTPSAFMWYLCGYKVMFSTSLSSEYHCLCNHAHRRCSLWCFAGWLWQQYSHAAMMGLVPFCGRLFTVPSISCGQLCVHITSLSKASHWHLSSHSEQQIMCFWGYLHVHASKSKLTLTLCVITWDS